MMRLVRMAPGFHAGLELQTKKDLMISKIISRAACLAELASNPKSFSNCPDLHGGSDLPAGGFRSGEIRVLVETSSLLSASEVDRRVHAKNLI